MSGLSLAERTRLASILGMLGSDHQGERDAAALAANRLVRDRGVAWSDLLAAQPAAPEPEPSSTAQENYRLCSRHTELLTDWERNFLRRLNLARGISPKQREILEQMAAKVRLA